jgi:hypothetical protein
MREQLKNINGVRKKFVATFSRYGSKAGWKGYPITTLLFVNVRDVRGKVYTDHIWFTTNKGFEKYNFNEGDNVCFEARVKEYYKGYYTERRKDYRLSHPNKITASQQAKELTLF